VEVEEEVEEPQMRNSIRLKRTPIAEQENARFSGVRTGLSGFNF
jgi:hypothetical protein